MVFFLCLTLLISGPVCIMVLEKQNAIADWRAMIGPTDATKAKATHPNRYYKFLSSSLYILCLLKFETWIQYRCQYSCYRFICSFGFHWSPLLDFSIRAMCGLDSEKNCVHGSDSLQSAQREISFFFEEETGKIYPRYLKYINCILLSFRAWPIIAFTS